MTSLSLFFLFAKFGLLAIGGGYVIIPLLYDTFVNQMGILSAPAFGNLMSIAQVTPGPVTINVATYVGYVQSGIWGAMIASLGLVFPSFFLTGTALFFLRKYQESWLVQGFLKGTRLMAFVMILYAVPLFLNMSVFSRPWPLSDILQSLFRFQLILPPDWAFHPTEALIFAVTFYCMLRKVAVTKLLIGSVLTGYIVSFL